MKWGPEYAQQHDLSARCACSGSVGEPINPEAWIWYREHIGGGRCPVVDTWWQTETGMILITPLPGHHHDEAGFGDQAVPRRRRRGVRRGGRGSRSGRAAATSCCAALAGDAARHLSATPSATCRRTGAKYETCTSRVTARASTRTATSGCSAASTMCMNVSGHRISTIEVECALVDHPRSRRPRWRRKDAETGQAIVAFVTLKGGAEARPRSPRSCATTWRRRSARSRSRRTSSSRRSCRRRVRGKIMRRLLRDVAENRPLGDTTTLADATVVDEISRRAQEEAGKDDA